MSARRGQLHSPGWPGVTSAGIKRRVVAVVVRVVAGLTRASAGMKRRAAAP